MSEVATYGCMRHAIRNIGERGSRKLVVVMSTPIFRAIFARFIMKEFVVRKIEVDFLHKWQRSLWKTLYRSKLHHGGDVK